MDVPEQPVVTVASVRRPPSEEESTSPEAPAPPPTEPVHQRILERLQAATDAVAADDVVVTVRDREVSLAQSLLAERATATRELDSGGVEVRFGTGIRGGDWWGWMSSLGDWVARREAHPLVRPPHATAETVPDEFSVAMTADWATGLYGAPRIAQTMLTMGAQRPFDLLMHLGDVYYSGTREEVEGRFLRLWPMSAGRRHRALNGNHDMYSGGYGYFEEILPAFGQHGSYFAVQNQHWLLLGLDTAYVDHDIDDAETRWITQLIEQADRRKVVLFSHQQPFSRLSDQGPKLQSALRPLLQARRVTAWYWGHEHQAVLYDAHADWGLLGRCLGNGGVPEPRLAAVRDSPIAPGLPGGKHWSWRRLDATGDVPASVVLDGENLDMVKASHQRRFVPHGFMTLRFDGPTLVERVLRSDGTELFVNEIG